MLAVDTLLRGLDPHMKALGFRKDVRNYRRITTDGLTHVINFQMSTYGTAEEGEFTVNLGIFVPEVFAHFYPDSPAKKVLQYECSISKRLGQLAGDMSDRWWSTVNQDTNQTEVSEMLDGFGYPFLDSFSSRDQILDEIQRCQYESNLVANSRMTAVIILARRGEVAAATSILKAGIETAEMAGKRREAFALREEARELGFLSLLLP